MNQLQSHSLQNFGWNEALERQFTPYRAEGLVPARVCLEHKHMYRLFSEHGELLGEIAGKLRYEAQGRADYPAVGDWVAIAARSEESRATIHAVLPRTSKFSRKAAGASNYEEQIVAANVDTLLLVMSLNHDFNLRRLERYLTMAWESGANPVIVLSKADLCDDLPAMLAQVEAIAFGVPVHAVSATEGIGLAPLADYAEEGRTLALLGSSGVGKSTLTNFLLQADRQTVQNIRDGDDRGRHTTTHRELFLLPRGGLVLDTPGMRELHLWEHDSAEQSFRDVEQFASQCRFADCGHDSEPGCAVKSAIESGALEQGRLQSFKKLQRELAFLERKLNKQAELNEKKKWKKINGDRTRVNRE
ncbi:ribosome small subunit-dependent GTPase A [Paenibacillus turpanensis]|uniref:ribosome small subunit-dependent GTPase A n=1 Tax=Paenibacillus turpanensis TaxID=2689078 RepID=UPI001FB5EEF0|nr:ribosome small subunit-dependent GTPase A [Paenibacillus turpanensis]